MWPRNFIHLKRSHINIKWVMGWQKYTKMLTKRFISIRSLTHLCNAKSFVWERERQRETERDRERQRESNEILKIKCEEYSLQWLDSLNHVDFKFPVVLFIYLLNDPSLHLLIQSQQRKYQNSVLNLYKMKSITSFWWLDC